jgi:SPP1 gp7 family putative phage head morphogenesis protein
MLLRPSEWDGPLLEVARVGLGTLAVAGAHEEMRLHGPDKALPPLLTLKVADIDEMRLRLPEGVRHAVDAFLDHTVRQPYWQGINATVLADLAEALKRGIHDGDSTEQAAERVRRLMVGASRERAVGIARTETTGALNAGHDASRQHLQALGLLKGVEWLCVSDGSTRPAHQAANGQVVNVGEEFLVGGERCQYPGDVRLSPGNRIACRCTSLSVLKDDA